MNYAEEARRHSEPGHRSTWFQWLNATAFVVLLVCIAAAPWPLGANRPWAWALLAQGAALALGLATASTVGSSLGRGAAVLAVLPRFAPLLLAVCFCLLVAGQVAFGEPGGRWWHTADPAASRAYLLKSLTYTAVGLTAALTVRSRRRCRQLLTVLLLTGLLQAVVAVWLDSRGQDFTLFHEDFDGGGRASGTFVNPDHMAGYMLLCLSAGVGLMVERFERSRRTGRGWQVLLSSVLSFVMSTKALVRLALVILVVALVMTHSRMGNGAFLLGLLLAGAMVSCLSRSLRRPALWLVGSMLLIDTLIIGNLVGLDRVVQRMSATPLAAPADDLSSGLVAAAPHQEQSLAERLEVPKLSLPLVAQRPWFGWGGGSYALAFAPIKPASIYTGFWDHAHNDYVQVAVDTGMVGFAMWAGIGLLTLVQSVRLLRDGQPRLNRGVGVAGLMAICCIGLHSVVDFVLHIPANALSFMALLALVWVVPGLPAEPGSAHRARSGRNELEEEQ